MANCAEPAPDFDRERTSRALVGVVTNAWPYLGWYEQAACRNRDSRLWFSSNRRATDLARRVCRRCAVAPACLALAIDHPELAGIWGGTDETERARARRELRRPGW